MMRDVDIFSPRKEAFPIRDTIEPGDRQKVFSLLNSSGLFLPREMAYGMDLFDEHFRKGENSHYSFVFHELNGVLLGYGCYGILPICDHRYHLHWLAVDKDHQHEGTGRLLEQAIVERVRALGGVKIYAQTSNRDYHAAARAFYVNCGYTISATVPDYYGDKDDMIFYVKDIV
jgi:ribosomal protein S18 acetylase RimI-like enzyme